MRSKSALRRFAAASLLVFATALFHSASAAPRQIVYLSAKADLPFWSTVGKGVKAVAEANGYSFEELDSNLNGATQLQNARTAIAHGVAGIVMSPTDSKTAPEVLDAALKAGVPVVIADVGTNGGEYVTYVKSDNYRGAYDVGTELAAAFKEKGWNDATFALITISLARKNGQDRTNGFRDAMKDAGLTREAGLKQMQNYSADETFQYVHDMLKTAPGLRGLFIETDQPVDGALRALRETKKNGELLIASFDAMPEVADLLKSGPLVAVGMQQPYLMGSRAAEALTGHLHGTPQPKQVLVPVLVATGKNISQLLPVASKTVFGK
jgi:ABC-type sugar transport system substrate-binding protein